MKYFIKTYGCQMNESDSERIASVLERYKHKKASKMDEADFVIINLCSVRQTAIDRIHGQFSAKSKLTKNKKKPKIILTGCILKSDKKRFSEKIDLIFDVREMDDLEKFLKDNSDDWRKKVNLMNRDRDNELNISYLKIDPKYKHKNHAFVPVMTGCNNFCSYCVVPYTRGEEKSRGAEDIIKEVEGLVESGYSEITLLGQNVNSYSSLDERGKKINFGKLLKLLNKIPGEFKISFITNHPKDMKDGLIRAIRDCKKVVKYIHLPFQSGDDDILKKMNRHYTQKGYLSLIDKIKKEIPGVKFCSDVIVGFPGETNKQFNETLKVVKKVGFDTVYVNKYSPREGALSAKKYEDDISWAEKKTRWGIVNDLVNKKNGK